MKINKHIEYTNLKPKAKLKEIKKFIKTAIERKYRSVVLPYYWLHQAQKQLKNTDIRKVTVFGFPFDRYTKSIITDFVDDYDELDIVLPLLIYYKVAKPKIKEIKQLLKNVQKKIEGKKTKLIIETALMKDKEKQIKELCEIVEECKIDVVKTNTGLFKRKRFEELEEDVKIIKKYWNGEIKASGGINTLNKAKRLIDLGANYIGTSADLLGAAK
jgi:deoxyribose-phosphate aldolase